MLTVVVLVIVAVFLAVAALVDLHARRRGARTDSRAYAAGLRDRRRDLRAQRSMMNLGGDIGSNRRR